MLTGGSKISSSEAFPHSWLQSSCYSSCLLTSQIVKSTKVFLLSTVLQHNKQLLVESAPVMGVRRSIGSFGQFVSLNLYTHTKQHQSKAVGVCCMLVSVFNILSAVTFESDTFKNTHR